MDFLTGLTIASSAVIVIIGLICMNREKSISGFYSQIGVCGRWHGFFALYLMLAGIVSVVFSFISLFSGKFAEVPVYFIVAGILGGIGYLLYKRAYNRCPDSLKKRLLRDLIVVMFGMLMRISLFFLMFVFGMWWEMNKPTAYEVNGRRVYAYPGSNDLYDESGFHVGVANDDRTAAIMD